MSDSADTSSNCSLQLADSLQLICKMILENDPTTRAKVVKLGGLDLLLENVDHKECLKCIDILVSNSRLAKSRFSPRTSFFRHFAEEKDPERLFYFWSISKAAFITRDRYQILCSSIFGNATVHIPLATELMKKLLTYKFSPVISFLASNFGKPYDIRANLLYDLLAKRDPCIRRTLAKRIGKEVIASLSFQQRMSGVVLLRTLASDLRIDCLQPYIVNIVLKDNSFGMVVVMHALVHKFGDVAVESFQISRQWKSLLAFLCSKEELQSSRARYALLLQLYMSGGKPDNETNDAFSQIIASTPEIFNIMPTKDRLAVERVVQVGRLLNVSDNMLEPHLGILQHFQRIDEQRRKLESIGMSLSMPTDFTCPVTLEEFIEPVVASDGHTYEKETLVRILNSTQVSPLTREALDSRTMIPNLSLKKRMLAFPDDLYDAIVTNKKKKQKFVLSDSE